MAPGDVLRGGGNCRFECRALGERRGPLDMGARLRHAAAIAENFREIVVGDDVARIERERREIAALRRLPIAAPITEIGEAELRPDRVGPMLARANVCLLGRVQSPDRFQPGGRGNVAVELRARRQLSGLQHDQRPALRAIPRAHEPSHAHHAPLCGSRSQHQRAGLEVVADEHCVMPDGNELDAQVLHHQHGRAGRDLSQQRRQILRNRIDDAVAHARRRHELDLEAPLPAGHDRPRLRDPRASRRAPALRRTVASAAGPHWYCFCGKNGTCVSSACAGRPAISAGAKRGGLSVHPPSATSTSDAGAAQAGANRRNAPIGSVRYGNFLKTSMTPTASRISSTTNTTPMTARMSAPAGRRLIDPVRERAQLGIRQAREPRLHLRLVDAQRLQLFAGLCRRQRAIHARQVVVALGRFQPGERADDFGLHDERRTDAQQRYRENLHQYCLQQPGHGVTSGEPFAGMAPGIRARPNGCSRCKHCRHLTGAPRMHLMARENAEYIL